jgi:PAS domain S-box-containing protein
MDVRVPSKQASKAPKFTGSLVRVVVSVLLVLTILPVLIMGSINYFRSQTLLKRQMMGQMELVVDNYMVEIDTAQKQAYQVMDDVVANPQFLQKIDQMLLYPPEDVQYRANKEEAISIMKLAKGTITGRTFSEISVLDPTGKVIASTNALREGESYVTGRGPAGLLGKQGAEMILDPSPLFTYRMMMFVSRIYTSAQSGGVYTIIGANNTTIFQDALKQVEKFLPDAHAYIFTHGDQVIGLASDGNLTFFANNQAQLTALHRTINAPENTGDAEYTSWGDMPVLSYGRWNTDGNFGLAIEAPSTFVYEEMGTQNRLNITILVATLLISGMIVWYGATRMVKPLVTLAANVQAFASGDWGRRTQIDRKDEIGLLAHAFNQMADELSQLYRSLEQKVEERNKQMLTAVEVAQYVTASLNRQEILQRTVDLITERFGYGYASIYLLDPSSTFFTSKAYSGPLAADETGKDIGNRIRAQSLYGLAVSERKIQIVDAATREQKSDNLISGAKSEVVIPISIGSDVVAVLDVQDSAEDAFGADTTTALNMVASQVASGLNNIAQVENAQVDLKETSLLYHASRQISQTQDRAAIWQILDATIRETDYSGMLLEVKDDQLRATAVMEANAKSGAKPPTIIMTLARFTESFHPGGYQLFDNLGKPSEYYPILSYFHQHGCKFAVMFPIFVDEKLAQIVVLASRAESHMTQAVLQQYLNLCEIIATAQERMNVMHAMEASLTELRTLATVSQAISLETDVHTLYRMLLDQIKVATGGELSFYIALYDAASNQIEFPFHYEARQETPIPAMPYGEGLTSILIRTQKPLLLSNNAIQQAAALGTKIAGEPARSWMGVPLVLGGEVFGAMVAQDLETDGRFTEESLRLFSTIAPQVAVSIRNAQLLSRMQQTLKVYNQEHYLLNTMLDNMPDSISFKDEQGRFLLCSKSLYTLRGIENEAELIGKTELDLDIDKTRGQLIYNDEMRIIQSGQPELGFVVETRDFQGAPLWLSVDQLPMLGPDGQATGLLSIMHDITDMKKAEQLAQLRAQQLLTTSEIARDTSGTLNVEELLEKSINLVRDRFGFYHASIFLIDPLGEYAVLRESTGDAGRQLKAAGHKLAVGSQSIVGQATGNGEPVVVGDVTLTANYYANPLLPLTRSELAIPLKLGERILGALDVQSTEADAFLSEDINILRILADQLTIAIFNADLFAETQENISKHRFLHQITTAAAASTNTEDAMRITVEGLRTAFGSDRVAIYLFDDASTLTVRAYAGYENLDVSHEQVVIGEGTIGLAALGRHPVLVKDAQAEGQANGIDTNIRAQLAVPVVYSDRAVGVLSISSYQPAVYDENDQEILGSMGSTLGAILANSQLVNQVRQQMEQQKQLFDITSKIRRSSDINTILQVSTRELATALRARRAQIRLMSEETQPVGESAARNVVEPAGPGMGANGNHGNNGHIHQIDTQELDR